MKIENSILNFCVGVWVWGHHAANFSYISIDAQENFPSFDTNVVTGGDWGNMVLNEKLVKKWKLRGLILRGLSRTQLSTRSFIYENDQRKKIGTLGDFDNKTSTHMAATHAISKSKRNFQNRFPRELDKKFYIPRFVVIYWITSNIQMFKIRLYKKVMAILSPGIQPNYEMAVSIVWV